VEYIWVFVCHSCKVFVCSWPRHLWDAWISSKFWHDWLPGSFELLDGGVSRTWTDANWIWHSLTNSGTIYDWCQIDTEIWVGSDYTIDLF
jgi:hypothetical protein